jgi:hypothetical protein
MNVPAVAAKNIRNVAVHKFYDFKRNVKKYHLLHNNGFVNGMRIP